MFSVLVDNYLNKISESNWKDYMDLSESIAIDNIDGKLSDEEYNFLVEIMEKNFN